MNNLNIGNRLIGITSDNEAKMISATKRIGLELNLQEFQHYRCTAHVLNLIVEAALSTGIILELVKMPFSNCTTRWNYTYYMID